MEGLGQRVAAALGLMLGAGPALLASIFPQAAGLNQLGAMLLGAILGMRAAGRLPCIGSVPSEIVAPIGAARSEGHAL
jgi:hypothetical protein